MKIDPGVCLVGTDAPLKINYISLDAYLKGKPMEQKKLYRKAHKRLRAVLDAVFGPPNTPATYTQAGEQRFRFAPEDRGESVRWIWIRYDSDTKKDVIESIDYDVHADALEREVKNHTSK